MLFQNVHKKTVKEAKQTAILKAIRKLRMSRPKTPSVSDLDMEQSCGGDEEEGSGAMEKTGGERSETEPHPSTLEQECQKCPVLEINIRRLKKTIHALTNHMPTPTPKRRKYDRTKSEPSALPRFGMSSLTQLHV